MDILDLKLAGTFETVSVARPTGNYVNGRWVPGASTTFDITASVQPVGGRYSGRQSRNDPVGEDQSPSSILLFTDRELFAADEQEGINGDIITWDGSKWEVTQVDNRPHLDLSHFRATARKRVINN